MAIVCAERDAIESVLDKIKAQSPVESLPNIWPEGTPNNQWRYFMSVNDDLVEIVLHGISEYREKIHHPENVAVFGKNPGESYQRPLLGCSDIQPCRVAMLIRPATEEEVVRTGLKVAVVHLEPEQVVRDCVIFKSTDRVAFYNPTV